MREYARIRSTCRSARSCRHRVSDGRPVAGKRDVSIVREVHRTSRVGRSQPYVPPMEPRFVLHTETLTLWQGTGVGPKPDRCYERTHSSAAYRAERAGQNPSETVSRQLQHPQSYRPRQDRCSRPKPLNGVFGWTSHATECFTYASVELPATANAGTYLLRSRSPCRRYGCHPCIGHFTGLSGL